MVIRSVLYLSSQHISRVISCLDVTTRQPSLPAGPHKGIVRDVNVRIFPSYSIPMTKVLKGKVKNSTQVKERIQATIVHRDGKQLVVLLPVEDQMDSGASGDKVQT